MSRNWSWGGCFVFICRVSAHFTAVLWCEKDYLLLFYSPWSCLMMTPSRLSVVWSSITAGWRCTRKPGSFLTCLNLWCLIRYVWNWTSDCKHFFLNYLAKPNFHTSVYSLCFHFFREMFGLFLGGDLCENSSALCRSVPPAGGAGLPRYRSS